MYQYQIQIVGAYDLLILTPEMLTLLIEKTRISEKRELHIPAEELLPQGYADYLIRVLEANAGILSRDSSEPYDNTLETAPRNTVITCGNPDKNQIRSTSAQEVYHLAARQIKQLYIQQQLCFDIVNLSVHPHHTQFHLHTGETFFMLAKQKTQYITYPI